VGTSLAVLGAYVLAGEIVKSKNDPRGALRAYEEKFRSHVEKKQKLDPGVLGIVSPSSASGVSVLNWVVWFVAWSGITKWVGVQVLGEMTGSVFLSMTLSESDLKALLAVSPPVPAPQKTTLPPAWVRW